MRVCVSNYVCVGHVGRSLFLQFVCLQILVRQQMYRVHWFFLNLFFDRVDGARGEFQLKLCCVRDRHRIGDPENRDFWTQIRARRCHSYQ